MRTTLPNVAQACDRTGVSDISAAILINVALKDVEIITKETKSYTKEYQSLKEVDRSKHINERN